MQIHACLKLLIYVGLNCVADLGEGNPTPPEPNPAKPVDYVRWYNQTYGQNVRYNAADVYRKAQEKITPFRGDWEKTTSQPWSDVPEVAKWLDRNQEGLSLFREAAKGVDCFFAFECFPPVGDRTDQMLVRTRSPVLLEHRHAVKGLIAEGFRAWAMGDHDTLCRNAILVLRSADHFETCPMLLTWMVAEDHRRMAYRALLSAVSLSEHKAALAQEILAQLRRVEKPREPFSQCVRFEKVAVWDVCQRLFRPFGEGAWDLDDAVLKEVTTTAPADRQAIATRGYDASRRAVDLYYGRLELWSRMPYLAGFPCLRRLELQRQAESDPLLDMMVADYLSARKYVEQGLASRRAAWLCFLLIIYKEQHGGWPHSLSELDSSDIGLLKIDPFRGGEFVYRVGNGSFTLYSVAHNLVDDGGVHDSSWKSGDYVFWPVQDLSETK